MAVAVTGSVGDLSHSRITTAGWHMWNIMRRSNGSRTGLGDVRCVLGRRAREQSRRYRRPHGPAKPAQFRLNSLNLAVLPSSGSFLMRGESDETPPYVWGSRSGAISGAPRSPGQGTLHPAAALRTVGAELRKRTVPAGNRWADVQSGHLLVTTIRREVRQTMNWITTLANPCDIGSTGRREWGVRMHGSCHRPPGRQGRP
jgi:hypothetical protein